MRISDWSSDVCSSDLLSSLLFYPSSRRRPGSQRCVPSYRRDPSLRRDDDKNDALIEPGHHFLEIFEVGPPAALGTAEGLLLVGPETDLDRKSTRLNSSH